VSIDWSFLRAVGVYALVLGAVLTYPLSTLVSSEALGSMVAGGVMSLLHVLTGYVTIEYSYTKKSTTFLKMVLGGMVARLFLMAGVVLVLLKYFLYDAFWLLMTMLVLYGVNLILEIYFLQKKVSIKNNA
jgi:hypothetical protein